jgi:voltage-gated potassium channel
MRGLWDSPARNLLAGVAFVLVVMAVAVLGYVEHGWSLGDAVYMTVITVYTVGYDEVRPLDTPGLRDLTIGLIVLGCTGMIFVTGALVQLITVTQIQKVLGLRRMASEIGSLRNHVIVCGFGRIGQFLAQDLRAGAMPFVVIEQGEARFEEARKLGYLALVGDAGEEATLLQAGIARARALATVLPDDAANAFITLTARSLNQTITIIARGEGLATAPKLRHAGANEVVQPAHIGAERMAELILYEGALTTGPGHALMNQAEAGLRQLGLELEMVVAQAADFADLTLAEIERRSQGAFFVVSIRRQDGITTDRPRPETTVHAGDGVMIVGRGGRERMLEAFRAKAFGQVDGGEQG